MADDISLLLLQKSVEMLLLPPGTFIVLGLAALILFALQRGRWLAMMLLALMIGLLYVGSLPRIASAYGLYVVSTGAVEAVAPEALPALANRAQAIVILGGGRRRVAPEYGGADTVSAVTLERLRYGAQVQRATGLDVLVSGGDPDGRGRASEAAMMAAILRDEFNVPVRWEESGSRTTEQNAALTVPTLRKHDVDTIVLVTHALHMPRAKESFELAGIEVITAPFAMPRLDPFGWNPRGFLPTMSALALSAYSTHELVGQWYYRWKRR